MNPKPNFFTRLLAETPPFWIKVQVISLIVLAAAGELAKLDVLPTNVYLLVTGAAGAVAFFAQCAVKDAPIVAQALEHPGTLVEHLPELVEQVKTLYDIATTKKAMPVPEITSEVDDRNTPTEAKIITMPARDANQPPATA